MTYAIRSGNSTPAPTPAQKLQQSYDRIDDATRVIDDVRHGWNQCDAAVDGLQRHMLAARVSLSAVLARPDGEQADALWREAGERVKALTQQAKVLGTMVATDILPRWETSSQTLQNESRNFQHDYSKVDMARARTASNSVEAVETERARLERNTVRFATRLAQTASLLSAPCSAAQAALAEQALVAAGRPLDDIETASDPLHLALATTWADGRELLLAMGDVIDEAKVPAHPVAAELQEMAQRVRQLPEQMRRVNKGFTDTAAAAAPLKGQVRELARAVGEYHKGEDVPAAQAKMIGLIDAMCQAVDATQAVPMVLDESTLPIFRATRYPTQRFEKLPGELAAQDKEHRHFIFFGRQYKKVSKVCGRAPRLMKDVGFYVERSLGMGTEIPRLARNLRRELECLRGATMMDRALGEGSVSTHMSRVERLAGDLWATLPDPEPKDGKKTMWPGLLQGAADRIEEAVPLVERAAQEADKRGV